MGGARHRTLTSHLSGWSAEQVAGLFARRPDLTAPPPSDLADLAQRAQTHPSVSAAVASADLATNRTLQVIVCCRPSIPLDELAHHLPDGVTLDDVQPVLDELEASALVWRHDGRVHTSGTLRQVMPTRLGPPLADLVSGQPVEYLRHAIGRIRSTLRDHPAGEAVALPPPASRADGRPPRKADLVHELEALVSAPGVAATLVELAPAPSAELARRMVTGAPAARTSTFLYYSPHALAGYRASYPETWLFEHALVLPDRRDDQTAVQPREVGVALRGGRPVDDLALTPPTLATHDAGDPAVVDAAASAAATTTLGLLGDLTERWAAAPVAALKSGGIGVTVLKRTAADLDVDVPTATRIAELGYLAGLLTYEHTTHREKRQVVHTITATASPAFWTWSPQGAGVRWAQLAAAWLRAEHWPSAAAERGGERKPPTALAPQYVAHVEAARRDVLGALAALDPGVGADAASLAAVRYWHAPQSWLALAHEPDVVVAWVLAEAELLGVVAHGALSSAGRALLAGDEAAAAAAHEASAPDLASTFTLQADLTAVAVGPLDREVLAELRLLADAESSGHAATFRFSDASLRRAFDAGRSAEQVTAFLEAHATKGVPKPLAYLVGDVARRYGNLRVGGAGSFVCSDDPAVLADACSARRTRKLGLRLLAPTVAVSALGPDKLLAGLRDAGFLPRLDGDDAPTASATASATASGAAGSAGAGPAATPGVLHLVAGPDGALPERFRRHELPHGVQRHVRGPAPVLDPAAQAALAEAVVAGVGTAGPSAPLSPTSRPRRRPEPPPGRPRLTSVPDTRPDDELDDELDEDDADEDLDELLHAALADELAVILKVADRAPAIVEVLAWDGAVLEARDLADGHPLAVHVDDLEAAVVLGALDDLPPSGPAPRPLGTRRRR